MEKPKPTILYIDDEPANLTVFAAALRRYYNILTTTSAHEGIDLLRANKVDLIITDQRMPDMTGVQFLEAIIPLFPEPVRMILTGFSDVDAIIKSVNDGSVLRYIMKPWDVNELRKIIDMGIQIHDLEKNNNILHDKLKLEVNKQQRIIDLFQKYVPLNVANQLTDEIDQNKSQEGETRVISILFADIRNFTKFSEKIDPKLLVSYLNQYFSTMINFIVKNQGSVYKLMGGGLIALFGAPISSSKNQRNAVMCSLDMLGALKQFNEEHEKEVSHIAEIGIGISTGETIVGRVDTEQFLSYMALGRAVDLALKTEELTSELPNSILITEPTYSPIKNEVKTEFVRSLEIDGKKENIYKVIGKTPKS